MPALSHKTSSVQAAAPKVQAPERADFAFDWGVDAFGPEAAVGLGMGQAAARDALPPVDDEPFDANEIAFELRQRSRQMTLGQFNNLASEHADSKEASQIISDLSPDQYAAVAKQYEANFKRPLRADLQEAFDEPIIDMAAAAQTWGKQNLSERVLSNDGWLNANEGGMLAALESASMDPTQRDAAASNPEVMGALSSSMGPSTLHKARLALATDMGSSSDTGEANTRYRAVTERIGAAKAKWLPTSWEDVYNIGNRSTFLNDDEQSIYDALLDLPMEQRRQLYQAEGELLGSIFNAAEMEDVARLCGMAAAHEEGIGAEVLAVETRMRLATEGLGTDEMGVHRAVQAATPLIAEHQQLSSVTEGMETRQAELAGAQTLTRPDSPFQSRMAAELSANEVSAYGRVLVGTADKGPTPDPATLATERGRRQHADKLRRKVHKRLSAKGGALGRSLTNADETAIQVAAEFEVAWDHATEDDIVPLTELLLLQAHYDAFERSFGDYEQALDGISGVAATMAAVAACVVVSTLAPPAAPYLVTALAQVGCGAAASLLAGSVIQGEQMTAEEAQWFLMSGALEGGLAVAGQILATRMVVGSGAAEIGKLTMAAGQAGSGGRAGMMLTGAAITEIVEAGLGDATMTALDVKIWQGVTWSKMGQIASALARGGLIGGLTGGVVGAGVMGTRRLGQVADEVPMHSLDAPMERVVEAPAPQNELPDWARPLEEPAPKYMPEPPSRSSASGSKPKRLSKKGKLRTRLKKSLGADLDWSNHQGHHLIPDEVVRKSKWLKIAHDKGWFDIDGVDNGLMMATKEDGKFAYAHPKYGGIQGDGAGLPMHRTSHGKFNTTSLLEAQKIGEGLKRQYRDLDQVPEGTMRDAIEELQEDLFEYIQTPDARLPQGHKRAGELAISDGEHNDYEFA